MTLIMMGGGGQPWHCLSINLQNYCYFKYDPDLHVTPLYDVGL
jgi:hypothetical protein